LTIAFAFVNYIMLPDFPENTKSLSPEMRALAELRMTEDYGQKDIDTMTSLEALWAVLTDIKAWTLALSLTAMVVGLAFNQVRASSHFESLSSALTPVKTLYMQFFPQLTATLPGFTRTQTLLLCAPPWAVAATVAFIVSRHSDKHQERYFHIIGPLIVGCIGAAIAMGTSNTGARYFSMFLMAQSYAGFVCLYALVSHSWPVPCISLGRV
jgi:hypothetical protein